MGFDGLESRQLMTGGIQSTSFAFPASQVSHLEPTSEAQYLLELINNARINPSGAANRIQDQANDPRAHRSLRSSVNFFRVDLNSELNAIRSIRSQQPLAWNPRLSQAADSHSQDMARNRFQAHDGSDGSSPSQRLDRVGYSDRSYDVENAFAYAESIDHAHQAFLVDWGVSNRSHRTNLLQPHANSSNSANEVGLGIVRTNSSGFGPLVVTQHFARRETTPYLLGVIFDDRNGDNFYNPGEGISDARVTARNTATGETTTVQAWGSGGFQMQLRPGQYEVTATIQGRIVRSRPVTISNENVKVDYRLQDLTFQSDSAPPPVSLARSAPIAPMVVTPPTVSTPAPAPAPAPAPTPAPAPAAPISSASEPVAQTSDTRWEASWSNRLQSTISSSANSNPTAGLWNVVLSSLRWSSWSSDRD
jgi:uncharacterized protein YkwD